jgi:transmembrane sensor
VSEVVKLRTRGEIDEEAALWIWRLDSGTLAAAEQHSYEAWLRQDPRHKRAIEEFSGVWQALDGLDAAKRGEKIATFTDAGRQRYARGARRWWLAAAAMLAMVLAGAIWLQQGSEIQTLATAVGQQRNVTLADGSVVTLNTNTIVETDLSRRVRQIYLRKGEAHFQVAHDRSRPFLVHAGDAVVRAVGTEFEVRLRSDRHVEVLVNEGRVEVQAAASDSTDAPVSAGNAHGRAMRVAALRALSAGQQLSTATSDYAVIPVSPAQLSSELAWREGAIIFDGEPLSEAIAEVERYTDARIVVSDLRTAALPVGGRFRTDDVQGFLDGLQAALPVSIRRTPGGLVYVDPRR